MPGNEKVLVLITSDPKSSITVTAVSLPGKDSGRLASVGAAQAKGTTAAKGGKLAIPADPGGALAYQYAAARGRVFPAPHFPQ